MKMRINATFVDDGSMTRAQRDASLKELQNSAATRVILISFKAGGLGMGANTETTICTNPHF